MLMLLWCLAETLHEIEELQAGLRESIKSEDYNRGLRWDAEQAQAGAEADRREAIELAQVMWTTMVTPGRQLDILKLERKIKRQQDEINMLRRQVEYMRQTEYLHGLTVESVDDLEESED